jgi:hypothetical protein
MAQRHMSTAMHTNNNRKAVGNNVFYVVDVEAI